MKTYTPEKKQEAIDRFISGESAAAILADIGIPKSTFYNWVRSLVASAIWLSAFALRSAITFLTGFSRNFLKMNSWIIRLQIWAKKVQPSSVINAWYSSISVSFRYFVKGSAYARNFMNIPGARKISSRPVTKP